MYQLTQNEQKILEKAQTILVKVMEQSPIYQSAIEFLEPSVSKNYLQMKIGCEERENFVALFLDNKHRLIKAETLFQGTVNETSVHVREIMKKALSFNAAALIVGHNHPSGDIIPSYADKVVTDEINQACKLMGIRLLDHLIVSTTHCYSFVESNNL